MIEIIKKSKERFVTCCPRCGCVFAYEFEDIDEDIDTVECPACDEFIEHVAWSRYEAMNTGFSEEEDDEDAKRSTRHGKIIKTGRTYPYCSLCDTLLERSYYKFCPYCGAKFDEKESNE